MEIDFSVNKEIFNSKIHTTLTSVFTIGHSESQRQCVLVWEFFTFFLFFVFVSFRH